MLNSWKQLLSAAALLTTAAACAQPSNNSPAAVTATAGAESPASTATAPYRQADIPAGKAVAIFAGGCFWCMEKPFDVLPGVESTTSGYTSGPQDNPSYREVSAGITGHTEAVKVVYDPKLVSYKQLLDVFWVNIDPTVLNKQFCDAGTQYRSGIYPIGAEQQQLAEASKAKIAQQFDQVFTEIVPATTFYDAEEYHQDYYKKKPIRYRYYRGGCGRDKRLEKLWGDKAKQ